MIKIYLNVEYTNDDIVQSGCGIILTFGDSIKRTGFYLFNSTLDSAWSKSINIAINSISKSFRDEIIIIFVNENCLSDLNYNELKSLCKFPNLFLSSEPDNLQLMSDAKEIAKTTIENSSNYVQD